MSTQHYRAIIVTGVVSDPIESTEDLYIMWQRAVALFERGLVSAITPTGHNFIASFVVFPTGSSQGREGQLEHARAVTTFLAELAGTNLNHIAVSYGDHVAASIISADPA